jgi:hypothetical protein
MEERQLVGVAPCWGCREPFAFDPDTVPCIPIDPESGLPPDLGGNPQTAVKQPICPQCVREFNALRRAAGQTLLWKEDDSA